jgi:SAM-dependent methyltransferase
MRAQTPTGPGHPQAYVAGGQCEAIPVADCGVDAALLVGVWHHLRDRAASAAELARVVRPHGTLLLRTSPSDRLPRPWWDEWFPEVYETDRTVLPSLADTKATITAAGWELVAIDEVPIPSVLSRRQDLERLQHRSLSTLEHLDDRIVDTGIRRIASALALRADADQPAPIAPQDLLVFRRQ